MDRQDGQVLIVRATKKLLDRIGSPTLRDGEQSTTVLGQWYATALSWRPQVALLVNEPTLLPVLMPLAPAATLPARAARHIAAILATHATPTAVIEEELRHMRDYRVAATVNRSVVGIMNEFRADGPAMSGGRPLTSWPGSEPTRQRRLADLLQQARCKQRPEQTTQRRGSIELGRSVSVFV